MSDECCHHWLIEPHITATSWGVCKYCGERREFVNTVYWVNIQEYKLPLEDVVDEEVEALYEL
jgi:hypothetical protein